MDDITFAVICFLLGVSAGASLAVFLIQGKDDE